MIKKSKLLSQFIVSNEQVSTVQFTLLLSIIFSLFFSRFLLTISILALFFVTVIGSFISKEKHAQKFALSKWLLLPSIVLIWYLISFSYSANIDEAIVNSKVKLLFTIIPFMLLSLYSINKKQISLIYHFFLLLALIGSTWSLVQIPYQDIQLVDIYSKGGVIPTIIHHIRFSLLVAFAAIVSWFLSFRKPIKKYFPNYVYLAAAIFFTVYLHILAVRSGLLGFYIGILFLGGLSLFNRKRLPLKIVLFGLGIAFIYIAFSTIPTLKSKVDYTVYSFKQYISGNENFESYSDNRRIISYKAALHVIKENPLTGVGIGDIQDEIDQYYHQFYPSLKLDNLHPHNQYLFTASAAGIPCALFLFLFNFLLLIRHYVKKNWLLVAFNLIFIMSFLVEDILEMQIGVITYLLFNYLGWNYSFFENKNLASEN